MERCSSAFSIAYNGTCPWLLYYIVYWGQGAIMKICNSCRVEKPFDDFFKDKNHSSGHYSICKSCKSKSTQKWRVKNREKYNEKMRRYNADHKRQLRSHKLKKTYNISIEEYESILASQDNKCWICKKSNAPLKRPFIVDHCHKTKKNRGILCYGCNRALHTLEKEGLLQRAFAYLEHFK